MRHDLDSRSRRGRPRIAAGISLPLALLAAACAAPPPPTSPASPGPQGPEEFELGPASRRAPGDMRLWGSAGVTGSPSAFFAGGQFDYFVTEDIAVGPRLQTAFDDDFEVVAPSFAVKKFFPLERGSSWERWTPYVQAGAGAAWLEQDLPSGGSRDDTSFLVHAGVGLEFALNEGLALGAGFDVDFLPGNDIDEDSFVTWRIIELGVTF